MLKAAGNENAVPAEIQFCFEVFDWPILRSLKIRL